MQFPSEFEWIAPSGRGLLTHYMPAHYSAGWWMDSRDDAGRGRGGRLRAVPELKKVAATRNVLLPVGTDYTPPNKWVTADPPGLERPLHLAAVRLRAAAGVLRRGPRRTASTARRAAVAADPGHEPDLHRQGRLLHRHQAGQPGRRERGAGRRAVRRLRRAAHRRRLPARGAGQGLGAAGLRRPPRRDHRLRVRPGLPRPADRLARRLASWAAQARDDALARAVRRWSATATVPWCGTRWPHDRTDVVTVPAGRRRSAPGCGCSTRRHRLPAHVEHDGHVGQLAGPRRAVAGLAGLPAGPGPTTDGRAGSRAAAPRSPTSTTG